MSPHEIPITSIKGVGPARAKALKRLGIQTVGDAARFLPRDYRDLSRADRLIDARQGCEAVVVAAVCGKAVTLRPRRGFTIVKAPVDDGAARATCVWYNQPWIAEAMQPGTRWVLCGKVEAKFGGKTLQNPAYEPFDGSLPGILPVYPVTEGVSQKVLRALIRDALKLAGDFPETLPEGFARRHGLMGLDSALHALHGPASMEEAEEARRRLCFEDTALFLLMLRSIRDRRAREEKGSPFLCPAEEIERFVKSLPFKLTGAQRRVLDEIVQDMRGTVPMNRLVQGDVGSGKTAIALGALYLAAAEGRQGAFMAPTEILAGQHFRSMQKTLEPLGIPVGLLTGSMKGAEKREALENIRAGRWLAVAGTHALIEKAVEFRDLGLVVTDEQHRFGVRQRSRLKAKGDEPDMLVMSATPVPRTLALILFGDLDISVVDELPPGRKPVKTRVVPPEKREDMYRYISEQAAQGRQAYVVCPLVEESDKSNAEAATALYEELREGALRGVGAALVHGRMPSGEKAAALEAFRAGEAKVLVSTTVIEVGVDVPNASVIAVENAERFGLAELHQLRGRVGRGGQQAWCFLCPGRETPESEDRLRILTETSDGFKVAEADLGLRGPGEFLGMRQSGMADMQAMRYLRDVKLLAEADRAVREVCEDPALSLERERLMAEARERFERRMEDIVFN
jgi:ATP-dependent DNA helicase RecG